MTLQEFIHQLQTFESAIPRSRVSFQIDSGDDWNAINAPLAIVEIRHTADANGCMLTFFDQSCVSLYYRRQKPLPCEKKSTPTKTARNAVRAAS
jgi:hypothetical protein